jgi:predicted aldo/keto reductase-like oxidoreductase
MEYRRLGRTGLDVGVIGLGTEHLELSRETMDEVLRTLVQAGGNYVDLLYIDVHGTDSGFWEHFGPALRTYRDRLIVQAHWGSGPRCDMEYCERCFDDVLGHAGNGYAEVALLTMVDDVDKWNGWAQESIALLRRYQEQGKVGAIGMSTHEPAIALQAVRSGLIDVLMLGVNLVRHNEAGMPAVYAACVEHKVGLVAMKPYYGGGVLSVDGKPTSITPTQCLAYVFAQPVATVVPGVKDATEMRAALAYLVATVEEKNYQEALAGLPALFEDRCTYCNHCLPCPQEINIGRVIMAADWGEGDPGEELRSWYASFPTKASACTECGVCLERCPFHVDVIGRMRRAVERYGG